MAIHLTPTELAEEVNMKRREVISKCMEMGVPIFNGRIDKTLFVSSTAPRHAPPVKQPAGLSRLAWSRSLAEIAFCRGGAAAARAQSYAKEESDGDRDRRALRPATGWRSATVADLLPARRAQSTRGRRGAHVQGGRRRERGSSRTFAEVGEIVARLSLGLMDLGDREGRQGRDPRQHAARVDLLRLRRAVGRRDRGADLPDQLAGGVPVRARELRRARP